MDTKTFKENDLFLEDDIFFEDEMAEPKETLSDNKQKEEPTIEFLYPPNDVKEMGFGDPQLFKKVIRAFDKEKGKLYKFNSNKNYLYASCRNC